MRRITTVALAWLAVASVLFHLSFGDASPATDQNTSDQTNAAEAITGRYTSELEAAGKAYAEANEAIRVESEERYAAAKTAYDAGSQRARDSYLKALEAALAQEKKSGNQAAADAIQKKIDFALNGPPRTDVQKLWLASYAAEQAKDYDGAIEALEKVIQTTGNAKNTFTQSRLGWLHLSNHQYDKAEAAYKTAAALAPQSITPRLGLMSCYLAADRADDAINAAREVMKLDPLNYRANKMVGDLLYAKREYARAGAYYQRLTTAHADDLAAATSLGWCYVKLDHKPLALQIFKDILAVQPDNVLAGEGYVAASDHADAADAKSTTSAARAVTTGRIILRNSKDAPCAVKYTLNSRYPVTLSPGQAQTLDAKQAWTIRIDEGGSGDKVLQRLQTGIYEFGSDGDRWKLSRR